MNKPAAVYCRVSTSTQATDGTSLDTQLDVCRRYAERNGYVIIKEIAEDITGTTLTRPGMDEIRDLAESGQISTVIIFHVDRFARDAADALFVYKELKRYGVALQSATVPIEDTPTGKLMFTVLAGIAELERAQIIDRTRRGKERRAREGRPVRTWMEPYGYHYVPVEAGTGESPWQVLDSEAEIVRLIFRWLVEEKLSVHAISLRLNDQGVPTKRTGYWGPGTIHRILKSELYIGIGYWNKGVKVASKRQGKLGVVPKNGPWTVHKKPHEEWIAFDVPPVVDQAMFEAAQKQLKVNSANSRRNRKRPYLLSGLIRCERCGCRYYGISKSEHYRYYRCCMSVRANYKIDARRCDNPTYQADYLERKVWEAFADYITAPKRVKKRKSGGKLSPQEETLQRDLAELERVERTLQAISQEEQRMLDAYRVGVIELDQLKQSTEGVRKRKRDTMAELARLQEQMHKRSLAIVERETLEDRRRLARSGLSSLDGVGKRALLEQMQIIGHLDGTIMILTGLLTERIIINLAA